MQFVHKSYKIRIRRWPSSLLPRTEISAGLQNVLYLQKYANSSLQILHMKEQTPKFLLVPFYHINMSSRSVNLASSQASLKSFLRRTIQNPKLSSYPHSVERVWFEVAKNEEKREVCCCSRLWNSNNAPKKKTK